MKNPLYLQYPLVSCMLPSHPKNKQTKNLRLMKFSINTSSEHGVPHGLMLLIVSM